MILNKYLKIFVEVNILIAKNEQIHYK